MKKLSFKLHIYLGFSLLIGVLLASLLVLLRLFGKIGTTHLIIDNIKFTFLVTAVLVFSIIVWLLIYVTKTFERQKRIERLTRKSNMDLSKLSREREIDNWILNGLSDLDGRTRGGLEPKEIAAHAIQTICSYVHAKIGLIYLRSTDNEDLFVHAGSYAAPAKEVPRHVSSGQGLSGECIASQKQLVLSDLPDNYLTISSLLGNSKPNHVVIQPLIYEREVLGTMEIGFFRNIDDTILRFLEKAGTTLAVASKVAFDHAKLNVLYEEMQRQAEELEAQQEELRTTNDELIYKTQQLEASDEELRVQQEELKHANAELEEKARLLEERNLSIEQARLSIVMKANQLEQSGKYKSEFLANMSHELRTPLNSILILAKLLQDNKGGHLLPDQVKYASVIHHAGTELLQLINNILDLSKIESGHMELLVEETSLSYLTEELLDLFGSVAENRSIDFRVTIDEGLPRTILTDEQRLRQILKNLIANAFKFTKPGGNVQLAFTRISDDTLSMAVKDTGIGISADKLQLIFEAFRQADGSTSRKFGGTGLGLSICRELATLLGGRIDVESQEGIGSTFTLILPFRLPHPNETDPLPQAEENAPSETPIPLFTSNDSGASKRLLIIEDDKHFAEILVDYAQRHGFETFVAHQGETGVQMALDHLPDAVILDIVLPGMDGWAVLKKLKGDPKTRDIPVHLMSADRPNASRIEKDAVGFLEKPVDQESLERTLEHLRRIVESPLNKVLLIEDQPVQSDHIKSSLTDRGIAVKQAFTGNQAIESLQSNELFDCIILDIDLPDQSGMELLDQIRQIPRHRGTPVIINTALDLNPDMMGRISQHTKTMVVKSDKSNSRILDEVNLFINRLKDDRRERKFGQAKSVSIPVGGGLAGKRILLVDDDMRNIFALNTVFELHQLVVETANDGVEALAVLNEKPDIDLVLMDIMMPGMDGFEAIAKIRDMKKFAKLPIIALTAKAMQGDRQQAIDAGANDYISKPVDVDKLLSLMRVWLS